MAARHRLFLILYSLYGIVHATVYHQLEGRVVPCVLAEEPTCRLIPCAVRRSPCSTDGSAMSPPTESLRLSLSDLASPTTTLFPLKPLPPADHLPGSAPHGSAGPATAAHPPRRRPHRGSHPDWYQVIPQKKSQVLPPAQLLRLHRSVLFQVLRLGLLQALHDGSAECAHVS